MSMTNFTQMSTDELIRLFVEKAKRAGSITNPALPIARSEERKQAAQEIQPIGAELRARKPIAKLRELFESQDPDVRGWAGGQFLTVDPIWAMATIDGLLENLTVRQVLELRERALEGPPPTPSVQEMTTDQLVVRFKDACTRLYATTRFFSKEEGGGTTMIAYNEVAGDSYAITQELKARGELDALLPLFDDPLITVRQRAATYCLPAEPARAIAVLEKIAATGTWPEATFASATIDQWRRETSGSLPLAKR